MSSTQAPRAAALRSWRAPLATLRHVLGVPEHTVSLHDRVLATIISFLGIGLVVAVAALLGGDSYVLLTSIGASAVLVFAVPHGPLSQPWAVIGGQTLSALVGVATAHLLGGGALAAAVAVAGSIAAMHAARCIHPPGGATALASVLTARATGDVAWFTVISPVLLDAVTLVVAATLLNAPFAWRRYPIALAFRHRHHVEGTERSREAPFTPEQLRAAFAELDTVVDISDEEAQLLYTALHRRHDLDHLDAAEIHVGGCYSNGRDDDGWSVRQIIAVEVPSRRSRRYVVRSVAGPDRGVVRTVTEAELLAWGRYEVVADDTSWRRVG